MSEISRPQQDTNHYFNREPKVPSHRRQLEVAVRGIELVLTTDRGVFSYRSPDFGSLLLLKKMELPETGDTLLDMGCGYGLLGLVAAKLRPEAHVTMVDINERATQLARENAAINGIRNVKVLTGDAPKVLGARMFDVVLCNPPIRAGKDEVYRLLADAAKRLRDGGVLWLVIRTKKGAKSRICDIAPLFENIETLSRKRGYRVFRCDK